MGETRLGRARPSGRSDDACHRGRHRPHRPHRPRRSRRPRRRQDGDRGPWLRPRRRGLSADGRAVAAPLEIVIALLVFVLVLSAYFSIVAQSHSPVERDLSLRSQAVLVSTLLITEPGHLDNGTADGTSAWEDHPASGTFTVTGAHNLKENLTGLGLALEGVGYGTVDSDKVDAMRKVRYEHARELLGLDTLGLHFRLVVADPDGTERLDYGPTPDHGEVHTFTRVVSLRQVNTTVVPVDFPVPDKVVINEIMWHPDEEGTGATELELEWVELYNPSTKAVNVSDWHLLGSKPASNDNDEPSDDNRIVPWDAWSAGGTATIPPDGYALLTGTDSRADAAFGFPDTAVRLKLNGFAHTTKQGLKEDGANTGGPGEKLTLVDRAGRTVEFVDYDPDWGGENVKNDPNNYTLSRIDPWGDADDRANWGNSLSDPGNPGAGPGSGGSPGAANRRMELRHDRTQSLLTVQVFRSPGPVEDVVVNEVMYRSDGTSGDREYVELYNPTDAAIDLDGWTLADGAETETLQGLDDRRGAQEGILPGGGYALVVGQDQDDEIAAHYAVHPGAVWLVADDPTLGHGLDDDGETLTVRNDLGHLMDQVTYAPDAGADGTGESLERVDPADGWTGANVEVSVDDDGLKGTPGRVNGRTVS